MDDIKYLSKQLVFYIHLVAIDKEFCEYDGHNRYDNEMRGIKDVGLFDSAIHEPMKSFDGKDLYSTLEEKTACYLRSLAMNHPFFDGNKRTALLSAVIFLRLNGHKITCDNNTLYIITKGIVENKSSIKEIVEIIKPYIRVSKRSKFEETLKKLGLVID